MGGVTFLVTLGPILTRNWLTVLEFWFYQLHSHCEASYLIHFNALHIVWIRCVEIQLIHFCTSPAHMLYSSSEQAALNNFLIRLWFYFGIWSISRKIVNCQKIPLVLTVNSKVLDNKTTEFILNFLKISKHQNKTLNCVWPTHTDKPKWNRQK